MIKRKANRDKQRSQYIDPPRFQSVTALTRTYRFGVSTSFNGLIFYQDCLLMAGMVCTVVNTTCVPLAVSFKIHRFRLWGCPGTAAANSTVSVRYQTANSLPSREDSNTAMTTSRPAFLQTKPPKGSSLDFQLGYTATNAVGMTVPAGGIVEVHATHWFYDTGAAAVATQAVAAGTLGVLYYGYLDQTSTKYMAPLGLPSTT